MKDWKRVQGSWEEKPAEFDTASSAVTVYQRRIFERVKVPDMDGMEHEVWECDERQMTHQEYAALQVAALQGSVAAIEDALCDMDAE